MDITKDTPIQSFEVTRLSETELGVTFTELHVKHPTIRHHPDDAYEANIKKIRWGITKYNRAIVGTSQHISKSISSYKLDDVDIGITTTQIKVTDMESEILDRISKNVTYYDLPIRLMSYNGEDSYCIGLCRDKSITLGEEISIDKRTRKLWKGAPDKATIDASQLKHGRHYNTKLLEYVLEEIENENSN